MFQHISHLLYIHDCLIIPGLGAFVGNPASAEISEPESRMVPPFKKIAFNISIQNNDGLLANYIAGREGISYGEANRKIIQFTETVKERLKNGEKVIFPQIGTLSPDTEGNIAFEADRTANYLTDAFGLPVVQCIEIPGRARPFKDRPAIPSRGERKHAWKIAVAVPVIALALWVSFETINNKNNKDYSFLNPFAALFSKKAEPPVEAAPATHEVKEVRKAVLEGLTPEDSRYFIIAGCFADFSNAVEELNQLKARGYDARLVGERKGMHVVSYHGYASREDANAALDLVRHGENPAAWILEK